MTVIAHVGVVIPAADEQDTVVACLLAVARAQAHLAVARPEITVDVVVVLDACRDATGDLVAGVRGTRTVVASARNVGAARRLGCDRVLRDTRAASRVTWLANTDADSTVPEEWLSAQVEQAERGAELVLGTVLPDLHGPAMTTWRQRHDTEDGHPHIHGANLGIRADVLAELGGWPALPSDEDVELVRRAVARGAVVARVGGFAVRTAARSVGRAPRGFSGYLAELLASSTTGDGKGKHVRAVSE